MRMENIVLEYLGSPAARRAATLELMARDPEEAFEALMNFRGPYPGYSNPVDIFPDYLSPLLTELLLLHPSLLTARDLTYLNPGQRWSLIAAVMSSASPRFSGVVLNALSDRSMDVRGLAIKAMAQCAFLRVPEARAQLKRLLSMKSMASQRESIQQALKALDEGQK